MSIGYDDSRGDRDVLRIPVIRVAYALSLLIHAAVLWPWPPFQRSITPGEEERKEVPTRFQVRIAPNAIPEPPPPVAQSRPTPPRPLREPAPRQPPASPAPVIALDVPGPPPPAPTWVSRPIGARSRPGRSL